MVYILWSNILVYPLSGEWPDGFTCFEQIQSFPVQTPPCSGLNAMIIPDALFGKYNTLNYRVLINILLMLETTIHTFTKRDH